MGMFNYVNINCHKCENHTEHTHLHDSPHGISGTHMAGSERYECRECGNSVYKEDGDRIGLKFILD